MLLLWTKLHLRHWPSKTLAKHVSTFIRHGMWSYTWIMWIELSKRQTVALCLEGWGRAASTDRRRLGNRGWRVRRRSCSRVVLIDAEI